MKQDGNNSDRRAWLFLASNSKQTSFPVTEALNCSLYEALYLNLCYSKFKKLYIKVRQYENVLPFVFQF